MYIIAGPAVVGNVFGYYGTHVPKGFFVVVDDGEYTNGGHGPSTVDGIMYRKLFRVPTGFECRYRPRPGEIPAHTHTFPTDLVIPEGVTLVDETEAHPGGF